MRRLIIVIGLLSALWLPALVVAPSVQAVDVTSEFCKNPNIQSLSDDKKPPACRSNPNKNENPLFGSQGILTTVANVLSLVAAVVAVVVIIIGGVKMIVSNGDPNSIASARRTVLYAVISLVIVLSAQAAVRFIISKF
jgi:hypothetical protein